MGTGIGKDCKICCEQLNYDDGFNMNEMLCTNCMELLPKFLDYIKRYIL